MNITTITSETIYQKGSLIDLLLCFICMPGLLIQVELYFRLLECRLTNAPDLYFYSFSMQSGGLDVFCVDAEEETVFPLQKGSTSLHIACQRKFQHTALTLLQLGCRMDLRDHVCTTLFVFCSCINS